MPAATTLSYHVNGPLLPQCNIGAANAYVTLGECQDGATVTITPTSHGIKSDGGGGMKGQPVEWIALNAIISVRFKLVAHAGTYLNKLRAIAVASATEGILPLPGTLFGANGYLPALYLPYGGANDGDGPWLLPTCKVIMPGGNNQVWTKETTPEFEFQGMVYYDPATYTSVSGRTLYSRSAP